MVHSHFNTMNTTAEDKNLYDLLGVKPDADETTIRKAYRKMALKWHPDKWGNATDKEKKIAEEKIKEYNEAQEILTDPQKRKVYDRYGYDAAKGNDGHGHHMNEEMMQEMFEKMGGMGGMGGFSFGNPFGGNRKEKEPTMANITTDLKLTFKQAFTGASVDFEVTRYILKKNKQPKKQDMVCTECKGKGMVVKLVQMGPGIMTQSQHTCAKCTNGLNFPEDFFEKKTQKFQQVIKKGIAHGESIVVNDMGHSVPDCFKDQFPGQKHSNLILRILSESHCDVNGNIYTRGINGQPANLKLDITIEPHEAICGTYKSVPYIDGNDILIKIPQGLIFKATANNGKHVIIVPNKGMPFYKQKNSFGELFVEVTVSDKQSLSESKLQEIWKIYTDTDMNEWKNKITKDRENQIVDGMFIDKYAHSEHYENFQQREKTHEQSSKTHRRNKAEFFDDSDNDDMHGGHPGGCAQQ